MRFFGIFLILLGSTFSYGKSQLSCQNVLRLPQEGLPAHTYYIKFQGQEKLTDRLDIESLMIDFNLSKFEAAEVQAQLRQKPMTEENFKSTIQNVKSGHYNYSEMNLSKIKNAKFVLVLDMDETLLDQQSHMNYISGVHSGSFVDNSNRTINVAVNPGALHLIQKAQSIGGAIVVFSRNFPSIVWSSLESAKVNGRPLRQLVNGILTLPHTTIPESNKYDIKSSNTLQKLLRKDLGLIDSDNVLIVDDNPTYVLQKDQLIVVRKFTLADVQSKFASLSDYQEYFHGFISEYSRVERELETRFMGLKQGPR